MEIKVNTGILEANEATAKANKELLKAKRVFTINVMGSPGAGKTTFLERTIELLKDRIRMGVIEGDIYTAKDAQRIEKHGIPVKQINTGGACHLDARMVEKALNFFNLDELDLMIIENVGNLVCPVEFNLGEDLKIAVLSITEGDDKPLKYPLIFKESAAVLINKVDMLEFTDVNLETLERDIRLINPHVKIFFVSARTEQGIRDWTDWLLQQVENSNRT
ncbi:hydrogenase nickel incorporation protein HypB [Thermincola ferriacetica]